MHAPHASSPGHERTTLAGVSPAVAVALALLGLAGLAVGLGLGWARADGLKYFFHAYLINYCYFLSISLGALFFVALQHATRAGWSVTVRRTAELLAANVVWLALLSLPILLPVAFGGAGPYAWSNRSAAAGDELLAHQAAYFDPALFAGRAVLYFAVWGWLGWFFLRRSVEQDRSGDIALTKRMERLGPPALLLLGLTVTFASFDWLMSLQPRWFSTIFGLYFISGAAVGFLAVLILLLIALQAAGWLTASVTVEHYHDLAKLLFALVIFWGYIAFSQYLLIWYANIPEETGWYLARQTGSWGWISVILLFVHLLIPFFGLLSRSVKRHKTWLGFWAAWLAVAHWVDLYYLVMPAVGARRPPLGPIDAGLLVGIGSLYGVGLLRTAGTRSLVPLADPRLEESLAFENV